MILYLVQSDWGEWEDAVVLNEGIFSDEKQAKIVCATIEEFVNKCMGLDELCECDELSLEKEKLYRKYQDMVNLSYSFNGCCIKEFELDKWERGPSYETV
jgi:hypothetical protein